MNGLTMFACSLLLVAVFRRLGAPWWAATGGACAYVTLVLMIVRT